MINQMSVTITRSAQSDPHAISVFHDLPTLETPQLRLRPLRLDDAAAMYAYARDPEVADPGMWSPLCSMEESRQDLAQALEHYAQGKAEQWGIEHRADGLLIGRCGFVRYSTAHARAELGYALSRAYWGQGYMTKAVEAAIGFGFETLGLHRIDAVCLSTNAASQRVLEKVGFMIEGIDREAYCLHGVFQDVCRYALLEREWGPDAPVQGRHDGRDR